MKKMMSALFLTMGLLLTASLLPPTAVLAEDHAAPEGEITIDGKKPARFNHQTHLKLKLSCGQCHHDAEHQPLSQEAIAKLGDRGQLQCQNCHNQTFANAKLQKKKQIFHARCKDCHKQGVADKKGPTKCGGCHISNKRPKMIEGC